MRVYENRIKVIKLYKSVQDYSMELHSVELHSVELHSAELCSVELCLVELSSNLNLYSRNTHFFLKKKRWLKKRYCGNESLSFAWDRMEVC